MQEYQSFVSFKVVKWVSAFVKGFHLGYPKFFRERGRHDHQGEEMVCLLHLGLDSVGGPYFDGFHYGVKLILYILHLLLLFNGGPSPNIVGSLRRWGPRALTVSLSFFLVSLPTFSPGVGNFLSSAMTWASMFHLPHEPEVQLLVLLRHSFYVLIEILSLLF